jgi:hypothetical protein
MFRLESFFSRDKIENSNPNVMGVFASITLRLNGPGGWLSMNCMWSLTILIYFFRNTKRILMMLNKDAPRAYRGKLEFRNEIDMNKSTPKIT